MSSQHLTILDIAKLANVGKSTVSRVLNQDPKVKDETREKVLRVIEEHQYVPSRSAQGMRGNKTKVIGIIVSRLDSVSENSAMSSMLPQFYEADYDVVIMESQFEQQRLKEHINVLKKRNVDGIVAFGFSGCEPEVFNGFKDKMVLLSTYHQELTSVIYNGSGAISLVLSHIKDRGFKGISYVGVNIEDMTTGHDRLQAYLDFCNAENLTPCYSTGALSYQSGYEQAGSVLQAQTQVIVCATDTLALGVAKRLHQLGRSDVLVTGVGGNDLLSFMFPETISVDLGYTQAGISAANLLLEKLAGQQEIKHQVMPIQLLV